MPQNLDDSKKEKNDENIVISAVKKETVRIHPVDRNTQQVYQRSKGHQPKPQHHQHSVQPHHPKLYAMSSSAKIHINARFFRIGSYCLKLYF